MCIGKLEILDAASQRGAYAVLVPALQAETGRSLSYADLLCLCRVPGKDYIVRLLLKRENKG